MSEPSLRDLQRWMQARIRPGAPTDDAAVSLNPQGGSRHAEAGNPRRRGVLCAESAQGAERLAVYAGGYLARTEEALAEVYEAIRHILGPAAFTALARRYAERVPSRDYNLSLHGRHLPQFLDDDPLTRELPFLPDLARLEWRVSRAFHAFDGPPVDPARLAGLPLDDWARAQLVFQPSVGTVSSTWPILDLWQTRKQPREAISVEVANRPQRVLVSRDGLRVRCEPLDEAQHVLLTALLAGEPLGHACEALTRRANADSPPPIQTWFARWTAHGLIADCRIL